MEETQELFSDSSSLCGSEFTYSSSSTVWGPGALTGKLLKAVGERSLDFVASIVIRRRLALIRQTLEKNPHIFRDPQTPNEWLQVNEIRSELKELCRECYTLSLRRTAANIIKDIVLLTRHDFSEHSKWHPLLARLQRPGGLLSMPPDTVIAVGQKASEASNSCPKSFVEAMSAQMLKKKAGSREGTLMRPSCSSPSVSPHLTREMPIEVGVVVEVTHSNEPADGVLNAKRSKSSCDQRCRNVDAQPRPGLEFVVKTSCQPKQVSSRLYTFSRCLTRLSWSASKRTPKIPLTTNAVLNHNASVLEYSCAAACPDAAQRLVPSFVEEKSVPQHGTHSGMCTVVAPSVIRTLSDIQHDLDRARKLVHDLELDLMYASAPLSNFI